MLAHRRHLVASKVPLGGVLVTGRNLHFSTHASNLSLLQNLSNFQINGNYTNSPILN